jgi:MoaA/NifB/PqqE/SkfB family radical SAM enzyme
MLRKPLELTPLEIEKREYLKRQKPLVYDKVIEFPAKLARGESIAIIQLQYNYDCNFRCGHCSISDFRHQDKNGSTVFTVERVRELARQADELGLAHIDITGGEPLLFKDMDLLVEAINPAKFYIQSDTNGWLMTDEKARQLKSIGIDKVQLSLDGLSAEEHDAFRRKPGSHERALRAIDSIKQAGLGMHIATVVTHQRIQSEEFIQFLEFAKSKSVAVSMVWPKLVGEWAGRYDILPTAEDVTYYNELQKRYHLYDHLTPGYGLDIGCLAVKRMISITQYGDVMPCPWMYFSLGNVFKEPLYSILSKGMQYFGEHCEVCRVSQDRNFIDSYVAKTYGRDIPVPIEEIMPDPT